MKHRIIIAILTGLISLALFSLLFTLIKSAGGSPSAWSWSIAIIASVLVGYVAQLKEVKK